MLETNKEHSIGEINGHFELPAAVGILNGWFVSLTYVVKGM